MSLLFLTSVLFSMSFTLPDASKREILLLAEHTMDPNLLRQEEILQADVAGLIERYLIVSVITPVSDKTRYDKLMQNRKGFLFILIGKDGGEKLISEKPVILKQLFGLIDSMPMRRQEMNVPTSTH